MLAEILTSLICLANTPTIQPEVPRPSEIEHLEQGFERVVESANRVVEANHKLMEVNKMLQDQNVYLTRQFLLQEQDINFLKEDVEALKQTVKANSTMPKKDKSMLSKVGDGYLNYLNAMHSGVHVTNTTLPSIPQCPRPTVIVPLGGNGYAAF